MLGGTRFLLGSSRGDMRLSSSDSGSGNPRPKRSGSRENFSPYLLPSTSCYPPTGSTFLAYFSIGNIAKFYSKILIAVKLKKHKK